MSLIRLTDSSSNTRAHKLLCVCVGGGGGGGSAELFTCPYPLKVQARPPRNQRLATQSRVSGREGGKRVLLEFLNS